MGSVAMGLHSHFFSSDIRKTQLPEVRESLSLVGVRITTQRPLSGTTRVELVMPCYRWMSFELKWSRRQSILSRALQMYKNIQWVKKNHGYSRYFVVWHLQTSVNLQFTVIGHVERRV